MKVRVAVTLLSLICNWKLSEVSVKTGSPPASLKARILSLQLQHGLLTILASFKNSENADVPDIMNSNRKFDVSLRPM